MNPPLVKIVVTVLGAIIITLIGILIFVPSPHNLETQTSPPVVAMATSTTPSSTSAIPKPVLASPKKAPSSTMPVFKNDSGVRGQVTMGPTCPVETMSPDASCAPKAYPTVIVIYVSNGTTVAAMTGTDQWGSYTAPIPPGDYTLAPRGGNPFPRCAPIQARVSAGQFTTINFECDTGIR